MSVEVSRGLESKNRRSRKRLFGCIALFVGSPFFLALVLGVVWSINNRPPKIDFPKRTMPLLNAADDFHRAYLLVKQMKHISPYSMPQPPELSRTDANFAACAKDAAPIIAVVRNGLLHQFVALPFDPNSSSPQYAEYREIARELAGAAEHYKRVGSLAECLAIRLDGLEMAAKIPHGDGAIGFLVAEAVQSISLTHVEELIPRLSATDLTEVGGRLDRIVAGRATIGDIVRNEGERTTQEWISTFRDPKTSTNPFSAQFYETNRWLVEPEDSNSMGVTAANIPQSPQITLSHRIQLVRFSLANKEAMLRENLEYFRSIANLCDRTPYRPALHLQEPKNVLMKAGAAWTWIDSLRRSYAASQAALAIVRTEVALEAFRRARARYPDNLQLLVPSFIDSLPDDPFAGVAGRPLKYRRGNNGRSYLLYSLGPDMTDNMGTPMEFYKRDQPGDIVAGRIFTPRRNRK